MKHLRARVQTLNPKPPTLNSKPYREHVPRRERAEELQFAERSPRRLCTM